MKNQYLILLTLFLIVMTGGEVRAAKPVRCEVAAVTAEKAKEALYPVTSDDQSLTFNSAQFYLNLKDPSLGLADSLIMIEENGIQYRFSWYAPQDSIEFEVMKFLSKTKLAENKRLSSQVKISGYIQSAEQGAPTAQQFVITAFSENASSEARTSLEDLRKKYLGDNPLRF